MERRLTGLDGFLEGKGLRADCPGAELSLGHFALIHDCRQIEVEVGFVGWKPRSMATGVKGQLCIAAN